MARRQIAGLHPCDLLVRRRQVRIERFDDCQGVVDEFHHGSAYDENKLDRHPASSLPATSLT